MCTNLPALRRRGGANEAPLSVSGKICFMFRRCRSRCSAGEPAACFPKTKFAYPYPTASPDMSLGKRKRVTPQLRREGGQHGMAELTNKKHPHFSSVQLSPSLRSPYCMPSREHQQLTEGWKKRKRSSDGESNWPESVSNVCIHGDTRQTGVGTRSVWEGHWQKKKVEREKKKDPGWCNKSCQWRIHTFMRQWDGKKWKILVFVRQQRL